MRVAAHLAMKARNLNATPDIKKAFRYHYQKLADKGLFKSPTSSELAKIGIDTSTWNEGEGFLPPDMKRMLKKLRNPQEKVAEKISVPAVDKITSDPEPPITKGKSKERKTIEDISNRGYRFKKSKGDEEGPPLWTSRHWAGEHKNPETGKWELKEGMWWNPDSEQWEEGTPRLDLYYWAYEFMYDPSKYADPCKYGVCHKQLAYDMQNAYRDIDLYPRDHLKTTWVVNHICWRILEFPELAKMGILNIAWDPGLAEVTFMDIFENLSQNEKILDFYGYVIDEERPKTQEKFYFVYQPVGPKFGVRCTSFKSGSITGSHPYWVHIDDPEDEPLSDTYMEKFKRIINKKIIPAVGKKGVIIITGTIKGWDASNDGYLWLEKNKTWRVHRYPAANAMPPMKDVIAERRKRISFDQVRNLPVFMEDSRFKNLGKLDAQPVYEEYFHVEVKDREKYQTLYPERYTIEDLVRKRMEMQDQGKSDDDFWSEYFLQAVNPSGKFFLKDRIKKMPPPGYIDTKSFLEWLHKFHHPVYLWIDPGGKGGHGIAIVVGTYLEGRYYFLDFVVIRAGLPEVAKTVARMIKEWGVGVWGVEGNFDQAEAYGNTIDVFLRDYMAEMGWQSHYTHPVIKNNTGDKIQRIATHVSNMIGLPGTDFTFFVNTDAKDYDMLERQITTFGMDTKRSRIHEFDFLDGMASMKIHLFPMGMQPVCIAV